MSYLGSIRQAWHDCAWLPRRPDKRPDPVASTAAGRHPYQDLPAHTRWAASHRGRAIAEIDPVVQAGFRITSKDSVATAGSCFAQHIARHLNENGYSYLVTEKVHPLISAPVARDFGYGVFSARYGNIYTARQLLQLVQRAYGRFRPLEDVWRVQGGYLDPFRPDIQPVPFDTLDAFTHQRDIHFAAVRAMFAQADVFVFTFGLTEAWMHKSDGAVFPVAPVSLRVPMIRRCIAGIISTWPRSSRISRPLPRWSERSIPI